MQQVMFNKDVTTTIQQQKKLFLNPCILQSPCVLQAERPKNLNEEQKHNAEYK